MLKSKTDQGFTLVELMVALAVVAILLTVAVPSFQNFISRAQLESVTGEIANVLKGARERAVTLGEAVSILQDADSIECTFVNNAVADECPSYEVRNDAVTVTNNNNFRFSPTGMLDPGGASISVSVNHDDVSTHRYEISILSSGRVSITQVNI